MPGASTRCIGCERLSEARADTMVQSIAGCAPPGETRALTHQRQAWIEFTRAHTEIPIFAVCAYFLVVFYVPNLLDESGHSGFKLRGPFAAWNLILAVFSLVGTTRTLPHLISSWRTHGFTYTACQDPKEWYSRVSVCAARPQTPRTLAHACRQPCSWASLAKVEEEGSCQELSVGDRTRAWC